MRYYLKVTGVLDITENVQHTPHCEFGFIPRGAIFNEHT